MTTILEAMKELTTAQRRVLAAFEERAGSGRSPPTLRELCERFGWNSTAAARDHVAALVKKGVLAAANGTARGTELRESPFVQVPHLLEGRWGRAASGGPTLSLPRFLAPADNSFAINVNDDGMLPLGLMTGDVVVASKTSAAPAGSIVVVTVGGDLALRHVAIGPQGDLVAVSYTYDGVAIQVPLRKLRVRGVVSTLLRNFSENTVSVKPVTRKKSS